MLPDRLTPRQQAVLDLLTNSPQPLTCAELGKALGIRIQKVNVTLKSLEAKRLAMFAGHREPGPGGKGRPALLFTACTPF